MRNLGGKQPSTTSQTPSSTPTASVLGKNVKARIALNSAYTSPKHILSFDLRNISSSMSSSFVGHVDMTTTPPARQKAPAAMTARPTHRCKRDSPMDDKYVMKPKTLNHKPEPTTMWNFLRMSDARCLWNSSIRNAMGAADDAYEVDRSEESLSTCNG